MKLAVIFLLVLPIALAEIHRNPGSTEPLPYQKYLRVVSEADSPVQQTYIKTKDGLYVAAAIRKPKGNGPFPVMIMFHGAPGGRGMEQLVGWSRGATGGPVWERFLQEGYVVAVADYRAGNMPPLPRLSRSSRPPPWTTAWRSSTTSNHCPTWTPSA